MKYIIYLNFHFIKFHKNLLVILLITTISKSIYSQTELDSSWVTFDNGCTGFVTGVVYDLDVYNGELYMVGTLDVTNTGEEINIAKWDGNEWNFISGYPYFGNSAKVMARLGDTIFIGGNFPQKIIGWNGSNWFSLGNGLGHDVYDIATIGNDVYVGGWFSNAGGVPEADRIAKWDGANWSALGTGIDGLVYAVAAKGDTLYVGGQFESVGGVTARNIAKWDGTNWSSLGSGADNGVNNIVFSIGFNGDDIIVGGVFTEAGDSPASRIAIWDGSTWSAMGLGVNGNVETIFVDSQDIYIGGPFDQSGTEDVIGLAKWTGNDWISLNGSITNNTVYSIEKFNNHLIAGGNMSLGGKVRNLGRWDGKDWRLFCQDNTGVAATPTGSIQVFLAHGDTLFVGGNFDAISDLVTNNIAMWDGEQWQSLGLGIETCCINSLETKNNILYAGGDFDKAGGKVVNNVAYWDGIDWFPMEIGFNDGVQDLQFIGEDLYAGGSFTEAGFSLANHIAKWDGQNWSSVGNGLDGIVYALSNIRDTLFIGGNFETAGNTSAKNIASYHNGEWKALGNGTNDDVRCLDSQGHILYAGGYFTQAGTSVVNHTAKWNGQQWSPLGVGVDDDVYSILSYGKDIYIGGYFLETKDGTPLNHAGKWDGIKWESLGSGLGENDFERVTSLEVYNCTLAVGGNFDIAGFKDSEYFALWQDTLLCKDNCFVSNLQILDIGGCDEITNTYVLKISIDYTAPENSPFEIVLANHIFHGNINGSGKDTLTFILTADGAENVDVNFRLIEDTSCAIIAYNVFNAPDSCSVTANHEILKSEINIYPNPAHDFLNINFNTQSNVLCNIVISDIYGRAINSNNYFLQSDNSLIILPVSHLSPGIYSVAIRYENRMQTMKIIKY